MITKQKIINGYVLTLAALVSPIAHAETSTNYQIQDLGISPMYSNSYTLEQHDDQYVAKPAQSQNYQFVVGGVASSSVASSQQSSDQGGGGQTSSSTTGGRRDGTPPAQSSSAAPVTPSSSSSSRSSFPTAPTKPTIPAASSSSSLHPSAPSSEGVSSSSETSSESSSHSSEDGSTPVQPWFPGSDGSSSSVSSSYILPGTPDATHGAAPIDRIDHVITLLYALIIVNILGYVFLMRRKKAVKARKRTRSSRRK